jgi:hypothetical protein
MGLFNFFRKKGQQPANNNGSPVGDEGMTLIASNNVKGINAIYDFLQFDYESRGYDDAMTNPDDSYKSDNIKLFNHDLLILIDKSTTYYEGLLKEVDFHISSRSRAGLIDLVEELKIRREMIMDHLEKIKAIKAEAANGTGATQRIALSYQRGFMKGLSAISQSKVFNKNL